MMKYCKCFVSLVAVCLFLGMAGTAQAELGACANPADGTECLLNQSEPTCAAAFGGSGVWQGEGTTACRDCDCDNDDDAHELEVCIQNCMTNTGGDRPTCTAACDSDGDGRPNSCPDLPYESSGYCCAPSSGVWTLIDDGYGCTIDACEDNGVPSHTPDHSYCDDANECTTDTCGPPCSNVPVAEFTPCGSLADPAKPCDADDSCNASGTCVDRKQPGGDTVPCRDAVDECDVTEYCNGSSKLCPADVLAVWGTPCGDQSDTDCNNPDTCNGSGTCVPRQEADGTPCTDDGKECTKDECLAAVCDHSQFWGTWKPCGDQSDTDCSDPDRCDGAGECDPMDEAAGVACPGDGNVCTFNECDGAGTCVHPNKPLGAPCGDPADTNCKNPDGCDGNGACVDNDEPDGTDCDVWPTDCYISTCQSAVCSHAPQPEFTPCNGPPGPGDCDAQDTCDDAGTCVDRRQDSSYVCRPSTDFCDPEETCAGGLWCPADAVTAMNMTPCTDDSNQCTNDVCWNNDCVHPNVPDWTPCDDSEVCTLNDWCVSGVCTGYNWDPCTDSVYCTYDECIAGVGCNNTYNGGPCGPLLVKLVPTGSGPITDSYQKGCFTVEVYVMDASDDPQGINCAFVDLTLGTASCPLSVMDLADPIYPGNDYQVEIAPEFPDFNTWWVDPPSWVYDFGGCTNVGGIGIGEWVLLGTVDVIAPNQVCDAAISATQSGYTKSSLIGQGYATAQQQETVSPVSMHCWGDLYDNTNAWGFVDAGDLSYFAPCWMSGDPSCEDFDYNMSGFVGPDDLGFFATAWQEYVCAGGIVIPVEQMRCNGYDWGPGGAASVSGNGAMLDEDGNVVVVNVPWASAEMIESFGLTVPPRDWEGWKHAPQGGDRLTPKSTKRTGVRSR